MNERAKAIQKLTILSKFRHLGWDTLRIAKAMKLSEAKVYNILHHIREEQRKLST